MVEDWLICSKMPKKGKKGKGKGKKGYVKDTLSSNEYVLAIWRVDGYYYLDLHLLTIYLASSSSKVGQRCVKKKSTNNFGDIYAWKLCIYVFTIACVHFNDVIKCISFLCTFYSCSSSDG